MKQFSKLNEKTEQQELAGKSAFSIFLELIHEQKLLFIKHDYLNQGDYSYFFTTEKIDDNYNILGILERKRSLRHAFLTLSQIKSDRLSFYFGIKRKTLFFGFYNEDTKYVYKVGHFPTTSSYLKKLYSPSLKNVRKLLEENDMILMNKLHDIKADYETFYDGVENDLTIKKNYRIVKKFPLNIFEKNDVDENRMSFTLLNWSRKFKWFKNVYSWVTLTDENAYFHIRMKDTDEKLQ